MAETEKTSAVPVKAPAKGTMRTDDRSSHYPGHHLYDLDCTLCPLHVSANEVCVRGRPLASLTSLKQTTGLVLGEAPGEEEDKEGVAFVGSAGKLLDSTLSSLGALEGEVFITNVVKCRPPGNRNPKQEEIDACRTYLDREIGRLRPAAILGLGRVAAAALGWSSSVTRARIGEGGSRLIHMYNDGYGEQYPCLITWHPAYILRKHSDRMPWEDDLACFLAMLRLERS